MQFTDTQFICAVVEPMPVTCVRT